VCENRVKLKMLDGHVVGLLLIRGTKSVICRDRLVNVTFEGSKGVTRGCGDRLEM
jgi:hypothetical protein